MKPKLFSTPSCGQCKLVRQWLDKANVDYEYIDCTVHPDITQEYGVRHVPTLVVDDKVYNSLPSIKEWIGKQKTN